MNTKVDDKAGTRYKRLPGRGGRRGGFFTVSLSRCSLYVADDHILAVDSNGFSEDYKRFYFSDIQAIITRRTRRGAIWSIVLALIVTCSLLGALFSEKDPSRMLFWILSGIFLLLLFVNILRGPTCICHIMTAVQEDQLPSLNRLRVARKVIGRLRLAIERIQGVLIPEELNIDQNGGISHPTRSMDHLRHAHARKQQVRHDGGTLHMMAFALLLLDGALIAIEFLYHSSVIIGASSVVTLIYSILIVIALVRQVESDIPATVRKITWTSVGFVCVSYLLSYVLMVTTMVTNRPRAMITEWDMYRMMLDLSPQNSPLVLGVYAFAATCSLVLGALGLVRVKKHRDHTSSASRLIQNSRSEVRG